MSLDEYVVADILGLDEKFLADGLVDAMLLYGGLLDGG